MRRWIVLTMAVISVSGFLGAGAADAKVPGSNGRILFVQDTHTCEGCHLTTIDPDGTDPDKLPGSLARWSPDGTSIEALRELADGRIGTLVMDADGSNITKFHIPDPTFNAACAAWSPDAQTLLCEVWDDVHPNREPGLFTVNATDGSDLTRLTRNTLGGHDIPADYSPDGTQIVFLRENQKRDHRHLAVFVGDSDGANLNRVSPWTNDTACCQASWSPDGSLILFASGGKLRRVEPDGTAAGPIPIDAGVNFQFALMPGWSPDGTRVVFSLYLSSTQQVDIFTAAADGSDLQQVTNSTRFDGVADWGTHPTI
jgi:hypothetical protein